MAAGDLVTDFTVAKFDGGSGAELWRKPIGPGVANAVTVDGAGNVVAAGGAGAFTVIKFDGGSGTELWRKLISDPCCLSDADQALAVTLDGAGDVVASGYITRNLGLSQNFTVVKLRGIEGGDF